MLFAAAAAIREKALEPFLIKRVQRKPVPVEPAAEIRQEGTLLMHRLRSVTLAAQQCCKSIHVECQRANAGVLGSCRCVIVAICNHWSVSRKLGGNPGAGDGSRIMPTDQPVVLAQVADRTEVSGDDRSMTRNNRALGIIAQRVQRHGLLDPGRLGRLVKQAAQLAGGDPPCAAVCSEKATGGHRGSWRVM